MNISKFFISFFIIIVLAISGAIFTISKMHDLELMTQKMYTHPFTVSNAIANIQTSIITIHRDMKDIVLTNDNLEMIEIIENIKNEENIVYKNFALIYKNYLGSKKDIDISYNAFKNWKPIRKEVIFLITKGKTNQAVAITKGKGAKHIKNLYVQIKVLKDYAFNKANEFHDESLKNDSISTSIYVFMVTFVISGIIIAYIIFSLLRINRSNNKQLYLIDQNILRAKLSKHKEVLSISSALCRALNLKKSDVLFRINEYFFLNKEQVSIFDKKIFSGKDHKCEVYITTDGKKEWFILEIFPEFDNKYKLISFNLLFTDITDKKRIEEVSITDGLTALHNRNYFEIIFEKEIKRAKRDKKELTVIMFDIDFFKQYNDTYGHQKGDIALKEVSRILFNHCNRSYDYAFRIGGEEFLILTYQKGFEKANEYLDVIMKDIEGLKISHKQSVVSNYLTISAGLLHLHDGHLLSSTDIYKDVDSLLYQSKTTGRNRFSSRTIE